METKLKMLLGVFVLLFGVWLGISAYNKYWKNSGANLPAANPPPTGQLPYNISKDEEARIKEFAESFSAAYYSYTWGSFAIIESLYGDMAPEMRVKEEVKINQIKEKMKNQPRKYFTVKAEAVDSELGEYQENKKADLDVKINVEEISGALVSDSEVPEIKPYTSAWVDSNKKVYIGNTKDLVQKAYLKNVKISLVKIGNEWKVAELIETIK